MSESAAPALAANVVAPARLTNSRRSTGLSWQSGQGRSRMIWISAARVGGMYEGKHQVAL